VGKTESPSRFAGPYGIVKAGEVAVSWTDNHSKLVGENVEVKHLQPAMPQAKGQECVVLNGLRCGKILEAKKVRKRDKIVTLTDGIGTWDEPFENVCVVEMSK
jgi:tRNA-binding EMAP/Myf-like protein